MPRDPFDTLDPARIRREAELLRAEMIRGFMSRLGGALRRRR